MNLFDRVGDLSCVELLSDLQSGWVEWLWQAAEKPGAEGGGGFNPRIMPTESMRAFSPGSTLVADFTGNIEFFRSLPESDTSG